MSGKHGGRASPQALRESHVKAFQFIEGRPASARQAALLDDDKENAQAVSVSAPASQKAVAHLLYGDASRSPSKGFPSTPATRVPLSDLLGNSEDWGSGEERINPSPEEHISWNSMRSPKTSASKRTPAIKGKKRGRSSSPPSTSQRKSAKRDVLDLVNLKDVLKTPKLDPAADLWNRYAVGADKDQTSLATSAASMHLAHPSSPHCINMPDGTVSGLRRWTSCGTEWPSSTAKRRKVNHTSAIREQVEDVFAESKPAGEPPGQRSSKSKIGSLIERIQESLAKPREAVEPQGPSSSSPLPDRGDSARQLPSSPTIPKTNRNEIHAAEADTVQSERERLDIQIDIKSSSSFGIDDLDTSVPGSEGKTLLSKSLGVAVDGKFAHASPEAYHAALHDTNSNPELHVDDEDDEDDFGGDLDMSGQDFEAVASLCDTRLALQPLNDADNFVKAGIKARADFRPVQSVPKVAVDEFEDEDLDEDLFVAAETAATQAAQSSRPQGLHSMPTKRIIQRYLVQNVCEGTYNERNGEQSREKLLLVEDDKTKLNKIITLRQSWFDTRCTKGSFVHVIGEFDHKGQCLIDDTQNMLILHPDHLISALVVADSFSCMRKSVLQDRIKATSEASPPLVYGTMLHEVFQEAMQANRWDIDWLKVTIESITSRHIEDLYRIKVSIVQAIEHMESKMPELQSWAEVFVRFAPEVTATVTDRSSKKVTMSINKLLDVEEHVWSPMFGLKGNIDATVQVAMQDDEGERQLVVPFEVKTGKHSSNPSHRAQTALYTLLLSDRYDVSIAYGILYYMETSEISRIPAIRHELRHMIMQRNELACYVKERLSLPPMVKNTHQCNRCYARTPCHLYHKLVENGDGETSGMREKFDQLVRHLSAVHQEFFKKWDDLLTKEESEMMKFKRELWTMLGEDREKHGRCFAKVVLDASTASEDTGGSKINRFKYTFRKHTADSSFSFSESHIAVGEPIVVSDEKGHYALALGYVIQLGKDRITVAVDRRLRNARRRRPGFDEETNQAFGGIMEVGKDSASSSATASADEEPPVVYRIDKDEFSNGLASVRNNLIQIMTNDAFHARELRRLVVEGVEPRFKPTSTNYELSGPMSQMNLNGDQREAIEKIMSAEDYALVLGMPGTGKTTTIAHIIRALVAKGKSVLLTSYTHTAVDNILLKLRDDDMGVLRLGAVAKVHPEVRQFARLAAEPCTTIEELERLYQEPQVVATTCLGVNHQIFSERVFDYCIVDEASQITLPVCLGPIRMAKTFVLVGDHYQLPPLVQNREAQEGGLDISLFKLLCERHPSAVVMLRHQYRMNDAIMSISNSLIYSGRLVCGSEEVANKRLELPSPRALASSYNSSPSDPAGRYNGSQSPPSWLNLALDQTSAPVVFLNTDTDLPHSREKAHGARITNPLEANLVATLSQALLLLGIAPASIGIITLYRSQLALIKSVVSASVGPAHNDLIEAHTTDRFQGRDKDVILLSCVRSNERDVVGELLKDWRRVNVAVTRAKKKLVIIGSKGTLSRGDELLKKLVTMCEENKWMADVPPGARNEIVHQWPKSTLTSENGTAATTNEAARQSIKTTPPASRPSSQTDTTSLAFTSGGLLPPPPPRAALQPRQSNAATSAVNRAFKAPTKTGKVTPRAVLGSGSGNLRARRPVTADVVREMLGEFEGE